MFYFYLEKWKYQNDEGNVLIKNNELYWIKIGNIG